jgi:hypothetical protein
LIARREFTMGVGEFPLVTVPAGKSVALAVSVSSLLCRIPSDVDDAVTEKVPLLTELSEDGNGTAAMSLYLALVCLIGETLDDYIVRHRILSEIR